MKKAIFFVVLFISTSNVFGYEVHVNNNLYSKGSMQCMVSGWVSIPYKPYMQFYDAGNTDSPFFTCYIRDGEKNLAITKVTKTSSGCSTEVIRNDTPSDIMGFCSSKSGGVYLGFSTF